LMLRRPVNALPLEAPSPRPSPQGERGKWRHLLWWREPTPLRGAGRLARSIPIRLAALTTLGARAALGATVIVCLELATAKEIRRARRTIATAITTVTPVTAAMATTVTAIATAETAATTTTAAASIIVDGTRDFLAGRLVDDLHG